VIYILPFFIFQAANVFIGLYVLICKIIKTPFSLFLFILTRFKIIKEKIDKLKKKKAVVNFDKSRRAFITSSAIFVSGYAFVGASAGIIGKNKYEITYQKIKIRNLPDNLKGTTFSLISDIHSGPYMDEATMKEYTDVINSLNSDFILLPGDFTNSSKTEIHPFNNAFKNLKAKYGIYGTLGNHDYFSDPDYIADAVNNESPIKMLRNKSQIININGNDLCIMGVEDTRDSGTNRDSILIDYIDKTIKITADENKNYNDIPKIMLCHKPYIFNNIADKNLDLIVSGHTHGGQIVFVKLGDFNLSIAASISKYVSGYYREGNSQMYVSRGIGTVALPIRLNCPPEITMLTLE
jgi:predicted MPP superfamily phosphohydrolase